MEIKKNIRTLQLGCIFTGFGSILYTFGYKIQGNLLFKNIGIGSTLVGIAIWGYVGFVSIYTNRN